MLGAAIQSAFSLFLLPDGNEEGDSSAKAFAHGLYVFRFLYNFTIAYLTTPLPCFFISYGFNGNLVGMGLGIFSRAISCNLSNLPPDLFVSFRHIPCSRRLHSAPRCTAQHGVHHVRCTPHYPARLSSPYPLHSLHVLACSVLLRRLRASRAEDCHSTNRQVPHLHPRLQPHHVHRNPRVCVSVGNAVTAAPSRHIRDSHYTTSACTCPCTSPCILQSTMPSSLLSLELRRRQLLFLLLCSRHVDRVRAHTLLRHRADIPGGRRHRRRRHACWYHVVLASVRRLHVCRRRCRLSCRCISRRFCV